MKRLYVVVRADLAHGLQLAQACHAAREFSLAHPGDASGENLVVLEAANETAVNAGGIFDPTWLSSMSAYGVLRCMDFCHTNDNAAIDYTDIATDACSTV